MRALWLLPLLVSGWSGCRSEEERGPMAEPEPAATLAPPPSAPAPPVSAPTAAAASTSGAGAASASASAGASQAPLELVWILTDLGDHPHPDIEAPRYSVDLLVRSGGGERRVHVGKETGALLPEYQRLCHAGLAAAGKADRIVYPAGPDELAKVVFTQAGSGGFIVRRAGKRTVRVLHFADGHEACDGPCVLPERQLTTFELPIDGNPIESIQLVDKAGKTSRYRC